MPARRLFLLIAALICLVMLCGCPRREKDRAQTRSASGNVIVTEPRPNDSVSSPVTLRGTARVFEAALSARAVSSSGTELGIAHFTTNAGAPEFGSFDARLTFRRPAGVSSGFVEVFTHSAKDGSVQDLVRIPVSFKQP